MEEKNIKKIDKSYITPQDSLCIYGIAILMMVWHHFFGFPERFHGNLQYIGGSIEYTIELYLGYFGRLCIAMYAFISGYGMMAKSTQKNLKFLDDVKQAIKQVIHFFIRYWIVFVIFIAIGLKIGVKKFEFVEFMKNFIGRSCSYNEEWWYVAYYVRMLITYPFVKIILTKSEEIKIVKCMVAILLLGAIIVNAIFKGNGTYYLCFWMGMLIYQNGFYDKISQKICTKKLCAIAISMVCIILSIVIRILLPFDIDALLAILYIFGNLQFLKTVTHNQVIRYVLQLFGKYSIYIWLTHTFLLYYYFQKQLIQLRYAVLIYVFTAGMCLLIGIILNTIYIKLNKGIIWKRKKM